MIWYRTLFHLFSGSFSVICFGPYTIEKMFYLILYSGLFHLIWPDLCFHLQMLYSRGCGLCRDWETSGGRSVHVLSIPTVWVPFCEDAIILFQYMIIWIGSWYLSLLWNAPCFRFPYFDSYSVIILSNLPYSIKIWFPTVHTMNCKVTWGFIRNTICQQSKWLGKCIYYNQLWVTCLAWPNITEELKVIHPSSQFHWHAKPKFPVQTLPMPVHKDVSSPFVCRLRTQSSPFSLSLFPALSSFETTGTDLEKDSTSKRRGETRESQRERERDVKLELR